MSDDIRNYLNIMRGKGTRIQSEINTKEVLNERTLMRNMLKRTRSLQKEDIAPNVNKATITDQKREENKFMQNFLDDEINVDFQDLEIYDNKIYWGGTIKSKSGSLDWVFIVSNDEKINGFFPNEESDFDVTIPENKLIMDKLNIYYDEFFKYWRDNEILDNKNK